ncbi:MAG: FN3 associated domain-containing protein [Lachnospiraceae bacterium]
MEDDLKKCSHCNSTLSPENMYCDVCGAEIQIVPDFEPDIEDSIVEYLGEMSQLLEDEQYIDEVKEVKGKKNIVFLLILISLVLIIVGASIYFLKNNITNDRKAYELYQNEQYDEAIVYYQKALEKDDGNEVHYINLSNCYYMLEKEHISREILKDGIKMCQENSRIYDSLIQLYERSSEYDLINNLLLESENQNVKNKYQMYLSLSPEYNYNEGMYEEAITIRITANTDGDIYFTTDESVPTLKSKLYSSPIFLGNGTHVIKAVFINKYGISSEVSTRKFIITSDVPQMPDVSAESGTYTVPTKIEVTILEGESIYYTTEDRAPTKNDLLYSGPIYMPIGESVFNFITYSDAGIESEVVRREYLLNIRTSFSREEAVMQLVQRLVDLGILIDGAGHVLGMSGNNAYIYSYPIQIEEENYYIVTEFYEQGGARNRTGNYYAINVMDGSLYRVYISTNNQYELLEL